MSRPAGTFRFERVHSKLCLVPLTGPDEFVRVFVPGPTVEHLDRVFRKTSRRTDGGWLVYRQEAQA